MKNILSKIKGLFISQQQDVTNKEVNTNNKPSSVVYKNNARFLSFKDSDCALILHQDNQVQVVFTKYYHQKQEITPSQELLMALAMYLKQPGFGDMLITEFHRIAMKNSNIFEQNNDIKEKK